jgi:hypothetical protein
MKKAPVRHLADGRTVSNQRSLGPLYDSLRRANEYAPALGRCRTGAETMPLDAIVVIVVVAEAAAAAGAGANAALLLPHADAAADVVCAYYCVSDWPLPAGNGNVLNEPNPTNDRLSPTRSTSRQADAKAHTWAQVYTHVGATTGACCCEKGRLVLTRCIFCG